MVNSGKYFQSAQACQGELQQSRKRRCPGVRPRHTVCKFICTDFTVGGGHRPPTLSLNGCWEATGLPYGITSANDLLLHYADCILCDMLRRTDVSALSQTNCRLESVPTADRAHTLVRPYNGMCRWISLSDNLFFPSDWARACFIFLRIWRVPAGIGWCSPITALPHACLPVRWWIRFRCDGSHAG